ncbi:MAG: NAD-dependent epimerase/dehydratase family protein [Proteobacteria bacterium]|nr:NAD-dependent epimerase/dehydratase family protein [Pseudomonadota bacterium]
MGADVTALVTGATGFVGSAVARKLIGAGTAVRVLVRAESDRRNIDGLRVETVEGELGDRDSLARALEGCDALYHIAADYRLWVPDPHRMYANNVDGTRNVMRAALAEGVERVVYTSSVATLGLCADGSPADEDTPTSLAQMIGHYKRSKFMAEQDVLHLAREEALPVVIVHPSAPMGPRDVRPTPTGRMILDAAAGRMPAYVDTGLNVVHVDDVARGHLLALEHGSQGQGYILGGEDMSLRHILETVAEIAGRRPPRWKLSPTALMPLAYLAQGWARITRGGEPRLTVDGLRLAKKHMYFSSAKARRELSYAPRPAREALQEAVDWFRSQGLLGSGLHGQPHGVWPRTTVQLSPYHQSRSISLQGSAPTRPLPPAKSPPNTTTDSISGTSLRSAISFASLLTDEKASLRTVAPDLDSTRMVLCSDSTMQSTSKPFASR